MKYIYSTMSSDNDIVFYADGASKNQKVKTGKVTINGKANVANKRTFITPRGALTTLDDKAYDLIKENSSFKKWVEKGFIKVETKQADADEVASKDMTKKDKSAQKSKDDYKNLKAEIVEEK